MSTVLAIDVESSNLPPKGVQPGSAQFPWPVQMAAVLFDMSGRNRSIFHSAIRAEGRTIAQAATAVHGISSKEAGRCGMPEVIALGAICALAAEAQFITGFNVGFDRAILESALVRLNKDPRKLMRHGLALVDLMRPSAAFCKMPSERDTGEYRWPKLDNALAVIRHERPRKGHHNALKDALAAKRLFLSLHHRHALDISEAA